jgi:NADH pyrophosphatase NudC (nudix superfamily)
MTPGSILLGAALVVLVGLFLARPFLLSSSQQRKRMTVQEALLAQKESLLAQIQILEFDFETGTVPEQDFNEQRKQLVDEAAAVLKKLDEVAVKRSTAGSTDMIDTEIEAAVTRLRQTPAPAPALHVPQPSSPDIQTASQPAPTIGRVKFCTQCGQSLDAGDRFCAHCGSKVFQPSEV